MGKIGIFSHCQKFNVEILVKLVYFFEDIKAKKVYIHHLKLEILPKKIFWHANLFSYIN